MNFMSFDNNSFLAASTNCTSESQPNTQTDNKAIKTDNENADRIQEIWNMHTFVPNKNSETTFDMNKLKMSWIGNDTTSADAADNDKVEVDEPTNEDEQKADDDDVAAARHASSDKEEPPNSPSHHARRPMNAFLIFCKKHRPIVREKFPNLENRGVTKILGEWWSWLDKSEKTPFTDLANEYKDAFLSANPDFKWYKLPAPPLRTLATRPLGVQKIQSPVSSPTHVSSTQAEFTPGKLADESQLGSLTSLLNNNYSSANKFDECCKKIESNNNNLEVSPVNLIKTAEVPPKPIKKRIFEQFANMNANVARNIMEDCSSDNSTQNMTNQELFDKAVDKMFDSEYEASRETRKSDRQCKGKRYEKFMVEGKLLGNKRDSKLTQHKFCEGDMPQKFNGDAIAEKETHTPKLDLSNTIKRLAERTNVKLDFEPWENHKESTSSISEPSGVCNNFNLDLRINNLPSLSFESFTQKKRESKKHKRNRSSSESKILAKKPKVHQAELVGSKKRKNKKSITHLSQNEDVAPPCFNSDLLGLATLAEVAASTQKINEDDK